MVDDVDLKHLQSDIDGDHQRDNHVDKVKTANPPHIHDEESSFGSAVETGEHQNTKNLMESVIGNTPRGTLAEEVSKDEGARRGISQEQVSNSLASAPQDKPEVPRNDEVEYTDTDASPPDDKQ